MNFCLNPSCANPQNSGNQLFCQSCGSELLLAGRYRVIHLLSDKGGFGNTYEVLHNHTPKVLKVLTNNHPKAIELFKQEAKVLSQLNHPGIPKGEGEFTYFPRDSQTPLHCLIMEKVEGMDLEEYQKQRQYRPIDQQLALEWLKQLAEILHEVHSHQFFHRDIKPSNIILKPDGQLALIDFGAVRQVTATIMSGAQNTGIYTPGYAPPEQEKGYAVPQSDFYALGRTFVYLLTGKKPTDTAIYDHYNNELRWHSYASNTVSQLTKFIDNLMESKANQRPANTSVILQKLVELDQIIRLPSKQIITETSPTIATKPTSGPKPLAKKDFWTRRKLITVGGLGGIGLVVLAFIRSTLQQQPSSRRSISSPKTMIVSLEGKGDYRSIRDAIIHAEPGMRILVSPGIYNESLTINKKIEIVGDGSREEIILESTNSECIWMQSESALVSGLTLRTKASSTQKKYFTVNISQGELVLENCDITSESLSSIAIHGSNANPIIRECRIHDGKESGIYFFDNGRGIVEDCEIFGNLTTEITIDTGSNPLIRRCKIYNGQEGGILIRDNGQGTIEDCEIFSNELSAIDIRKDSNPIIRRCKLYKSKKSGGVYIYKNGQGTIEDCEIFNNKLSGVLVSEGGNPLVQRCKIHDGEQNGIMIYDNGKGTVEDCTIFSNAYSGVEIRKGGNPVIKKCKINQNYEYALYIHSQGMVTIENCDLTNNKLGTFYTDNTAQIKRIGNIE